MARISGAEGTAAGTIVVSARRLRGRVDPLAAYAAAGAHGPRSVWLRPDAGMGLAAIGAVEAIEPAGADRFSGASVARAVLAARIRRHGPGDAPAPVLVGGFSFAPGCDTRGHGEDVPAARRGPAWDCFGDSRLVLPELTVIDRPDGTWVQAATRVGPDGDEAAAEAELEERLASFAVEPLTTHAATVPLRDVDDDHAGQPADADRYAIDDDYLVHVTSAVAAIERGDFQKVVLARTVALDTELDPITVLDLLRGRNPTCAVFAFNVGDSTFLGATPEELVTLNGPLASHHRPWRARPPGATPLTATSVSLPGSWRRPRTDRSTGSWWTASPRRSPNWARGPPRRRSPVCCGSAVSSTCARP